jgi:hypothetical protein
MRNFTLLALFLSLLFSARAEIIEKTYYFSNPVITQHKGYQQISFGNDMLTAKPGNPALPYSSVSLLLPPGEVALNIEFIGENKVTLEGQYNLWPYQPSRPLSETEKAEFYKNGKIYNSRDLYPASQYGRLSSQFMNGYGFAFSTFTPVQYIPAEGKISYYSKVTIRITTGPGEKAAAALQNLSSKKDVLERVSSLAQNPGVISAYPEKAIRSDDAYELLIITTQQYEDSFSELQDIYLTRGVRSHVFTTEYIQDNIGGQDLQEKIRNFIIQEYQESGAEYVLLGGDVELVPYRGFYCYVQSGDGYEDDNIPADLYYSALDGNWNDDGDNRWGEPDEDDLLPDIAVARFSFSNNTELSHMINKSISYQNSPVLGELRKPLLAGEWLYGDPETWGMDYLQLLIGEHDDNGYSTTGIPEDYDIQTMYEHDQSWSGTQLINKINQGIQFLHHVGHANETYVAHLDIGDITDENFYATNGVDHNYTIMQTHGCICGAFDYNDCILERMVSIQNFAVAVVGNSRYGWFNEGQTEGPAAHLHREMVDAMFHEKIARIGKAFVECKIQTAPWVEAEGQWEEGALRWNFYDINIIGDPAMSVWNDEPIDIDVDYPAEIPVGLPSINVTVTSGGEPMENFHCVIMKDGELRSLATTDQNGLAVMEFNPTVDETGEASLIVSGYDCLPDTNDIMFIPAEGAYVVYAESDVDDSQGNNNGSIDYGEAIWLNVGLENVGAATAVGVETALSTENPWVSFTDGEETYGDIPAGETVTIDHAFAFDVADNIPDQMAIVFSLDATDGNETWNSEFQLRANAPVLSSGNMVIDDSEGGNGNGLPDPGETITFTFAVSNTGHSACTDALATISADSPFVVFSDNTADIGDLGVNDFTQVTFTADIDEDTPAGTSVELQLDMTTGAYSFTDSYFFSIGIVMEDFETGDLTAFDWNTGGNAPWFVTDEDPYDGDYCARSGDINDDEHSDLTISLQTMGDGEISFFRKVSSEENYDYLKFYIDGTRMGRWSGVESWGNVSYTVSEGNHILKWAYEKDMSVSEGSDCGWLDNIVFPATTTVISVEENTPEDDFSVFPNPNNGSFYLNSTMLQQQADVKVYDISGRTLLHRKVQEPSGTLQIQLDDNTTGLYFIRVQTDKQVVVKKVMIR